MISGFDFPTLAVFISAVLIYVPHTYKTVMLNVKFKSYNNAEPRATFSSLENKLADKPGFASLRRATAAHQNLLEVFPIFAAGVVLAKIAGVDKATLDHYAFVHIVARALYIPLYVLISSKALSNLRSLAWFAAIYSATALIFVAARASA